VRVVIIGSGLIGITSAYFLARRGWGVTVLDRQTGPARETSFANGALLTPSMAEPWNSPGCWMMLLKSLSHPDSALQLRLNALPSLAGWGARFLWNSRRTCYERNTLKNLILALHSLETLKALRRETHIKYGQGSPGTLRVFRDLALLDRATEAAERLKGVGLEFRRLPVGDTVFLEPALAPIGEQLAGGIHYPCDEIGDSYRFCLALAEQARQKGVEFHFSASVTAIQVRRGKVSAVRAEEKCFTADQYILAAGSYTPSLLAMVGIGVPVRPAKGYSITFQRHMEDPPLRTPIVDDDFHAVVVPLENDIRLAGTAEFAGYDLSVPESRIRNLLTMLKQVLPHARLGQTAARIWCGLRSMSVDGVPIIGATPIENLWINTGHGHLGWTMAAGSAQLLTELMTGEPTTIDAGAYALARFADGRS
jgi:D-amino-acid dehydrogenase